MSGMGIVYAVYDHQWHEAFAAKTFQARFLHSKAVRDRFVQEAGTWIALDAHQNIVRARFVEIIRDQPYLFLEFVADGDLSSWIGTPRLTLLKALRFAIQFCHGMEYASAHGIKAHRDIKPQNCLILGDETLKITDFGLARVFDDPAPWSLDTPTAAKERAHAGDAPERLGLTKTRAAGTPIYMAPEQFRDAKHVDVHADIYSFGVMLYQMITGGLPFKANAKTTGAWQVAHEQQPIPTLREWLPEQVQEIEQVVQTCLAKRPSQRYESFGAIRERLQCAFKILTGEETPAPTSGADLDVHGLNCKGSSLNFLGRYADARRVLDQALQRNPHISMSWNNMGFALTGC